VCFQLLFVPTFISEVNVSGHRLFEPGDFVEKVHSDPIVLPNKRPRSMPGDQQVQRPCLDFEKMQQVKVSIKQFDQTKFIQMKNNLLILNSLLGYIDF